MCVQNITVYLIESLLHYYKVRIYISKKVFSLLYYLND